MYKIGVLGIRVVFISQFRIGGKPTAFILAVINFRNCICLSKSFYAFAINIASLITGVNSWSLNKIYFGERKVNKNLVDGQMASVCVPKPDMSDF